MTLTATLSESIGLALFFAAVAARLFVPSASGGWRGDEVMYLCFARWQGSIRSLYECWISDPDNFMSPSPLRWGYISLLRNLRLTSYERLALLSRVAGAALVLFSAALAPRPEYALLVASSPIAIGLSRRALQDTLAGLFVLLTLVDAYFGNPWLVFLGAFCCLCTKEATVMGLGAIALVFYRVAPLPIAAAVAAWGLGSLAVLRADAVGRLVRIILGHGGRNDYTRKYQEGPPWRGFTDLALVSPAVAVGFFGLPKELWCFCIAYVGIHGLQSQTVRTMLPVDAVLRIGTAVVLGKWAILVLAWDLVTAYRLRDVYDPVTANLTRALKMAP